MTDPSSSLRHRLLNLTQTLLLIGGMMLLLGLTARLLFGEGAFLWTAGMVAVVLLLAPRLSPRLIMRLYQARPLTASEAPELLQVLAELARRAGLPQVPALYWIDSPVMNAFAVGQRESAAIAVTRGLLERLTPRELAGVLAHELSHVRNNDMWVMGLADTVSRLTANLSLLGQLMILVNLPLLAMGGVTLPWSALLLLVFAPAVSTLLQLALSRTREYDADLGAVLLTGDPDGLASALAQLERQQGGWIERVLFPEGRNPNPSWLRTHPPTEERIRRLRALAGPAAESPPLPAHSLPRLPAHRPRPRRHWPSGLWY
ncbi:zinc metalloprotease HtpX [Thiohalobacter sp.]|uniref:zinc metalloprotease HtpX n=1 Tax=Thiohalobacter sp. TaxID=2025948 RepID=UPI00260364BE|nr:zinc metalloprotease HtpX [Thiohalobacter sp.]